MGLIRPTIRFTKGQTPNLTTIETLFVEKTGLLLITNSRPPSRNEIGSYQEVKKSLPHIGELFIETGDFSVDGFESIEYSRYSDKITISYSPDEYYFPNAIMWVLEELGGQIDSPISDKYKVKWSERNPKDKLKS